MCRGKHLIGCLLNHDIHSLIPCDRACPRFYQHLAGKFLSALMSTEISHTFIFLTTRSRKHLIFSAAGSSVTKFCFQSSLTSHIPAHRYFSSLLQKKKKSHIMVETLPKGSIFKNAFYNTSFPQKSNYFLNLG